MKLFQGNVIYFSVFFFVTFFSVRNRTFIERIKLQPCGIKCDLVGKKRFSLRKKKLYRVIKLYCYVN